MALEYVTNPEETYVFRGDVIIADIVDGKIKMRAEHRKYAIGAGKFWKAFKGVPATETLHVPSPQDTVTEAGFVKFISVEVEADIPPAPEQDPALGSKTPEYWAWLKRYYPEQAEECHKLWANR